MAGEWLFKPLSALHEGMVVGLCAWGESGVWRMRFCCLWCEKERLTKLWQSDEGIARLSYPCS